MSKVMPCLWFDGQAEEAARLYVSLIPDSRIDKVLPYEMDMPGGKKGDVLLVIFTLAGQSYMALNGGSHFKFTPAVSFIINCENQAEIDRLWDKLLEGGEPMQCGWLSDKYGVSWQIVPARMGELMSGDPVRSRRVTEAMLKMVKIDLGALERAYDGKAA